MKMIFVVLILAATSLGNGFVWSGNGHTYEAFVQNSIRWEQANDLATSKGGYLATITSQAENDFVSSLVFNDTKYWNMIYPPGGYGPWLGGRQPAGMPNPSVGWEWITGEPWIYTNWSPPAPNNQGDGVQYLHYDRIDRPGMLDDARPDGAGWYNGPSRINSYIVEYNTPEPATLIMFGIASILFFFRKKRGF